MGWGRAITRRGALRSVGTGVGLGFAAAGEAPRKRTITVAAADGEPVWTERVPADWYDHARGAVAAARAASRRFGDRDGVVGVGVEPGERSVEGRPALRVSVRVDGQASLPGSVGGVPVATRREASPERLRAGGVCGNRHEDPDCLNTGRFDPVPGGVAVTSDFSCGTTGCRVSYGGETGLLTAAHIVDDSCEPSSHEGTTFYQRDQDVGSVAGVNLRHDWAVITGPRDVSGYVGAVRSPAGSTWSVTGHVTEDGLLDVLSAGTTVHKIGVHTGHTTGAVERLGTSHTDDCWDLDGTGVDCTMSTAGGDSGAPIFVKRGDAAAIVSTNSYGREYEGSDSNCMTTPFYGACGGYPAHRLVEGTGIAF